MMMTVEEMVKGIREQQAASKAATTDRERSDAAFEIGRLVKMLRNDHALDEKSIGKILSGAK